MVDLWIGSPSPIMLCGFLLLLYGQVVWKSDMGMLYGYVVWVCCMDMWSRYVVWLCCMDRCTPPGYLVLVEAVSWRIHVDGASSGCL